MLFNSPKQIAFIERHTKVYFYRQAYSTSSGQKPNSNYIQGRTSYMAIVQATLAQLTVMEKSSYASRFSHKFISVQGDRAGGEGLGSGLFAVLMWVYGEIPHKEHMGLLLSFTPLPFSLRFNVN